VKFSRLRGIIHENPAANAAFANILSRSHDGNVLCV
jgi:hypothetical protein